MWKKLSLISLLLILVAGCTQTTPTSLIEPKASTSQATEAQATPLSPTATQPASAEATMPASVAVEPAVELPAVEFFPGLALPFDRAAMFSASGACTVCHSNMIDTLGNDVSVDRLWRASMLANAARDPYWQATVRSENNQASHLQTVIDKKCATCHMPLAEVTQVGQGQEVMILDQGMAAAEHPLHNLALDGVSCTLCHQIEPDNLGQPDSFSGGYLIDSQLVEGERLAYGPFQVSPNHSRTMQGSSGFIPQQATHLAQSEVCGSCHDLYTPFVDGNGEVVGEFAEQLIYSEWANSSYANSQSCQNCHMPAGLGKVKLSITGGPNRSPVQLHAFVGGNAYMLRMLQYNAADLSTTASTDHFNASIAQTITQIANQTARLALEQVRVENGLLLAELRVENLAGHKFPAGFPSRRAWLQVRLLDSNAQVIFESGAYRQDGAILGNDNDENPATYEPHYTLLSSPDQVQIYEGIMVNSDGEVTTTLLRGAEYLKDNRLLPVGFTANPDQPELNPQGQAAQDANFMAGSDSLSLELALGDAAGPYTLEVRLLYQSIAYRWAENLRQESGAEIERFGSFYDALPNLPLVAVSIQTIVTP